MNEDISRYCDTLQFDRTRDPYTCVWIYILPLAQLTKCVGAYVQLGPKMVALARTYTVHHNATDEIGECTDRLIQPKGSSMLARQ